MLKRMQQHFNSMFIWESANPTSDVVDDPATSSHPPPPGEQQEAAPKSSKEVESPDGVLDESTNAKDQMDEDRDPRGIEEKQIILGMTPRSMIQEHPST